MTLVIMTYFTSKYTTFFDKDYILTLGLKAVTGIPGGGALQDGRRQKA